MTELRYVIDCSIAEIISDFTEVITLGRVLPLRDMNLWPLLMKYLQMIDVVVRITNFLLHRDFYIMT